jgi:hypothetical protein
VKIKLNELQLHVDRSIEIPQSCNGVARFDFEYLCGRPVISQSHFISVYNLDAKKKYYCRITDIISSTIADVIQIHKLVCFGVWRICFE